MSRLELEGMLVRLKKKKFQLATDANALIKSISSLLTRAILTPLSDIDIEGVESLANQLLTLKKEYMQVLDDIKKVEMELE